MQEYVLVYARLVGRNDSDDILIVEKMKPAWQKGKYNLVGGKVEPGESPIQASIRELQEEAGMCPHVDCCEHMGTIVGSWGFVYCVKIPVWYKEPKPSPGEIEKVFWASWYKIKNSTLLMPNLRVIIPMMRAGTIGWVVADEGPSWGSKSHTIAVTLDMPEEN